MRRLDAAAGESGAKIHVTSGYRCRARNRAVGGTENSYHLAGRAFDFVAEIEGDTGPALLPPNRLIEWLRADLPPGGVGTYGDARRQNIVHYDTGPARSWGPHARRK